MTTSYMSRALELARASFGETSPNPPVGAVVVRGRRIVGEGRTQPTGEAHAEVVALLQAGELARDATLYVTLEPCSHFGRTPPCTNAIIVAGIAAVHASIVDPNPRVSGRGFAALRGAGISVIVGEGREEATELAAPHTVFITTGVPMVTLKFAMSLDGKIATRVGDSKWITCEESRRYVHTLRARSDAIVAGIGTVLADDPQLTARDENDEPLSRQPLRVVVDSRGNTPPGAAILRQPGKTLVAVSEISESKRVSLESAGAEVFHAPTDNGRVDLRGLLTELGRREITSVLVESGGALAGSLFDARLVHWVVAFVAPVIIGGDRALSPVGGQGATLMSDAMRLSGVRVERFGEDVAVIGRCSSSS
ncbi:MAG: bifunctional diaminohydroxyphosphoribosylaminopyrimidine deaminase/5-amino-6-(5-phosphoribosylamino)uracil reductase RibD [Dehalococcoidia bacterium]|nr:bifunctional diaminohydroxyphosphoribosylaminopyrimidine deaminase/5-amino-6-(5-phosphoribosylamino)uracil reductase RibD [Dehalococcoidia bacterium]